MRKNSKKQDSFFKNYKWLTGILFVVFSLVAVGVYIQFIEAAVSSYDFSGITNPSATHIARTFEVDVDFPTNGAATIDTLTDDGTTTGTPQIRAGIIGYASDSEASTAEYAAISISDDNHWVTPDPGFGDTQAFWTQFQIAETPANITQIDIAIEGYQGGLPPAGRNAWLGIWVPGAPTPYWKTLESSQETTDHVFSSTLTTNLADYIDGSGNLTIILYNEDQSDSLYIDYMNVDVTFGAAISAPGIISMVADDPDNLDRELSANDTFTIIFDKSTNAPLVAAKADVDGLLQLPTSTDLDARVYDHILGVDYTGAWSTTTFANDTLTITIVDGTVVLANDELPLTINDVITIKADGTNDLKDSTGTSDASAAFGTMVGNWGLRPDDDITYASDHNANAQIHEVSLLNEYHYRHATPYKQRADLTYVGYLPIATYAIGRRPSDGLIFAAENGDETLNPAGLQLAWMDPEKNDTDLTARGAIGRLGAGVKEFYRLVFTASGVLYGAANDNKLYLVYDTVQAVPAGTHGAADNLAGNPICTMQPDLGDLPALQLGVDGSADFAFDDEGKLFLVSNDILYWVETGPLVGGVITSPCTAHAVGDTSLNEISGVAFTKGGQYHISTFLPGNRTLGIVDIEDATNFGISDFNPTLDIYDLGSVPKWTDIEIEKIASNAEFIVGQNNTYTLTVWNDADVLDPNLSDASGPIKVTDILPDSLTLISVAGAGWTCDSIGQYFECMTPNNLPKGTSLPPITVTVNVLGSAEPLVMNEACVDSTTFEKIDIEDCDNEPTPAGLPNLVIAKTPSDAIVNPGQVGLEYTIRLTNDRSITGTNITVNDPINEAPLDAYLENLRNITLTDCGRPSETKLKINGTELRPGENPVADSLIVDGRAIVVDILNGSSNSDIASTIASAINADDTHHANADENAVTIYHGINGAVSNGKTVDTSALEVAINAADLSDDDAEIRTPNFAGGTDAVDNSTATEVIVDSVAISPYSRSAQECLINYTVDVKSELIGGTIINNRADATAPLEGGSAVFAEANVEVSDTPILSPSKVDDDVDNIVGPGQTVTYTLTIDNIGNKTGTGISVDDTLNTNLENLLVTNLTNCGGAYVNNSTANPPVLNIDGVQITTADNCIIEFTADVKGATGAGVIIPNTAYVSAAIEGGFPTNAPSDDLVTSGAPSLTGTKVHNKGGKTPPNEVDPGELVQYTLTIDNVGDINGTGISADDTLDVSFENLNVISLTNCGGAPADTSTANPPVLNIDNLQVTTVDNCVIVFEVNVKNTVTPGIDIPNIASVSPAVEGGLGDPNIPSINLHVPGAVAITTTKVDNDADNYVNPSQTVTYTLTLNNTGDVTLTGIHTLDTMDSDLENLNVVSVINCGSNYQDQSSVNPPELDIRGLGGDPNKGLEVQSGVACIITFTAQVKATAPGTALIPNVATVTESQEGAPATTPASDVLEVAMPSVSAVKVDDDPDDLVSRGQTVEYTINLINAGTGTRSATGVDIYDAMDSDLENLNVTNVTNCGGAYSHHSTADPPILDIDDLTIANGTDCVIVFTADVKPAVPATSTIPNTVLFSASDEGAPGGGASSDILIVPIVCGDSFREGIEQCDDGNNIDGDGCDATCNLESCGDGIQQPLEECDDGNNVNDDGCSAACLLEICGDGVQQAGEQCDDGNNVDNDGCNAICVLEICGDGIKQPVEGCDDGNVNNNDGCSALCVLEFCGDGTKQTVEQCDDGNNVNGDGCDAVCVLEGCGDGIKQPAEGCDDGNVNNNDGCSALCILEFCGDGTKQTSEQCDDGNNVDGDGCEGDCTLLGPPPIPPPTGGCGNGVLETNLGERCDDGNTRSGDGCSSSCQPEGGGCTGNCSPPPPPPPKYCFEYDPDRPITFNDLDLGDSSTDYVNTLKDTKIRYAGDYVLSGNDNHSTGKQQEKYQSGIWDYQSWRPVRRMEAIKAILVSNCIPIEDEIPIPEDGFRFRDVPVDVDPSNDLMHFTARVFYTAYKKGIITENEEGLAHPFRDANLAETLAIALRTSKALTKRYLEMEQPWYRKYVEFARDYGILDGIESDPASTIRRDDFAKIIFRIMWHNPRSYVHGYARQFNFFEYSQRVPAGPSVFELGRKEKEDIQSKLKEDLNKAADTTACLIHDPNRRLEFVDVPEDHWAHPYIEILRTTQIKNSGDYIASGHGNPSTGNTQSKYQAGDWEYRPEAPITFFEFIKVALVINCIPIENTLVAPNDGFRFRQIAPTVSPNDEFMYFAGRVMYTAYKQGVIRGDIHPFIPISRLQALAILSRLSDIIPSRYEPKILPFSDVSSTAWYAPTLSYLYENGLITGYPDGTFRGHEDLKRSEMAKFVTLFMRLNQNPNISRYGKSVSNLYGLNF